LKNLLVPILIISIWLFAELGSYFALRNFFIEQKIQLKWFNWLWWGLHILFYLLMFGNRIFDSTLFRNILVNFFFILISVKLVIALSYLITIGIQGLSSYFQHKTQFDPSRRKFAAKIALGVGALPLSTMLYGIFRTAYNFRIHKVKISSSKIPTAFKGLKVVQISDIHTGSLQQKYQLEKAVDLILKQKPDLIVFTGDLVNNRSDEALPYVDILQKLQAPLGTFSILGNHDYGDYERWESDAEKEKNMQLMFEIHEKAGWKLMMNEHLQLEKDGAKINLLGVENWGANLRFKKYGKLKKAYEGLDESLFSILLSHDPSHWTAEVKDQLPAIDLTLSGHTHGFQFGVEIPGFKWSPSQYVYPQWAGLYKNGSQHLYVNRGLGCLGYMGRVGIQPEITVIELG
jgi:hypothetical protein